MKVYMLWALIGMLFLTMMFSFITIIVFAYFTEEMTFVPIISFIASLWGLLKLSKHVEIVS